MNFGVKFFFFVYVMVYVRKNYDVIMGVIFVKGLRLFFFGRLFKIDFEVDSSVGSWMRFCNVSRSSILRVSVWIKADLSRRENCYISAKERLPSNATTCPRGENKCGEQNKNCLNIVNEIYTACRITCFSLVGHVWGV